MSTPPLDDLIAQYDQPRPIAQARRKWQLKLARKRTPYADTEAGHTQQIKDFLDLLDVPYYKHWQGFNPLQGFLCISTLCVMLVLPHRTRFNPLQGFLCISTRITAACKTS